MAEKFARSVQLSLTRSPAPAWERIARVAPASPRQPETSRQELATGVKKFEGITGGHATRDALLSGLESPHHQPPTHLPARTGMSPKSKSATSSVCWLTVLWALACSGCASFQNLQIDPSGRRIFTPVEEQVVDVNPLVPGVPLSRDCVTIGPGQVIAPVGSEVVLVAGICGSQGRLLEGRRVEWMVAPEGVGEIVTVGRGCLLNAVRLPKHQSRKLTNQYAVSHTQRSLLTITRGTANPADDTSVQPGQSWISVTSPSEGTSRVTAFAPSVPSWSGRKATATVHWVDAQWSFPPPAVNPLGQSHVFTTTVARSSDGSPIAGWIVRYEILGGPPAGFAPDGSTVIEVPTDELGQASTEIVQTNPQGGTSRIGIQIIRPAREGALRSPELIVATGTTTKTWTAPQLGLSVTGPSQGTVGATLTYRLQVSNPGDLPTQDVVLSAATPGGLTFANSTPPAQQSGGNLQWNLGGLGPQQSSAIEVNFRAEQAGSVNFCATARTTGGLEASDCAATTVTLERPNLEVSMLGPPSAPVGSTVRFQVIISNTGSGPATGLTITDRFDEGLEHLVSESPIERDLEDIPAGGSRTVNITFRARQAGELCHDVTIAGDGGISVQARGCVTATEPPPATRPAPPTTEPQPKPQPTGQLEVSKTGPAAGRVGQAVVLRFTVRNTGEIPLTNLRMVNRYDAALQIRRADPGFERERLASELAWTLARLEPGAVFSRQIECECVAEAEQACGTVTASSDQTAPATDRTCLRILRPAAAEPEKKEEPKKKVTPTAPSNLTLSITDLAEGQPVGSLINYRVFVTNEGAGPARSVRLVVRFPAGLTPLRIQPPLPHAIDDGVVTLEPINEIAAGQRLIVTIPARATRAGQASVTAELSSERLTRPLRATEKTDIAGGRGAP